VARSAATGSLRFPDLGVATFALLNFLSGCAGGSSSSQSVNPNIYTISGAISPSSGGSGSTLTLSGPTTGSTTADGSGNYSFTGLANGTYVVSPTHSGYTFSPSRQTVTINGTNATGVNFIATQTSYSVALLWIASVSVVSGYNVYRGTTSGGPYTKINSSLITTLSYTDSSVTSGNTYYYVCTAVDLQGVESIYYSNQATAQIP